MKHCTDSSSDMPHSYSHRYTTIVYVSGEKIQEAYHIGTHVLCDGPIMPQCTSMPIESFLLDVYRRNKRIKITQEKRSAKCSYTTSLTQPHRFINAAAS